MSWFLPSSTTFWVSSNSIRNSAIANANCSALVQFDLGLQSVNLAAL
jgi:hypothetical protein